MGGVIDPLVGQVVGGRYRVLRLIGRGGMGTIYEVEHLKLRRKFALKKLAASLLDNAEALARFQREADVVARFRHPNVVEIIDWETLADGSPCMIMEYLQGEDLAHRIARAGALPWPTIAMIADAILSALSVSHRSQIVHRDLKPQNIFLAVDDVGDERAKLLDFGVSKIRHSDSLMTGDERMLGTPAYMAPEQADPQSGSIGPASDCWAIGAILYEMAAGRGAFGEGSPPAVLYRICHGAPQPLAQLRVDAPPAFLSLVDDILCRDPQRRVGDIETLRRRLRSALAPLAPGVFPTTFSGESERTSETPVPPSTVELTDGFRKLPSERFTTLSGATGSRPTSYALRRPLRRTLLLLAVSGGLLVVGLVVLFAMRSSPPIPTATVTTPATPATEAPPAQPAVAPQEPRPAAPPMAAPRLNSVFVIYPKSSRAWLDGVPWTGHIVERPSDNGRHRVLVRKPGFVESTLIIDSKTEDIVQVELDAKRIAPKRRPAAAPPTPLKL